MGATPYHSLKSREEIRDWIIRTLGYPFVKVELTEEHVQDSIEDAVRWFVAKKGVEKQKIITIDQSDNGYLLPEDVDVVLGVDREYTATNLAMLYSSATLIDDRLPYVLYPGAQQGGGFSAILQSQQYSEMGKRILSSEEDWRQEGRMLYLFPAPNTGAQFRLRYKANTLEVEKLSERDHDLIKRFAMAMAKMRLGNIRSKYSSFPGAQGNTELDGARLLSESQSEVETLTTEVAQSGFPLGFIVG